ncbi:MAG: DUF1592 domain-containing protein [Sandaracinaceae bacterium]|nr:DUF1592 domain-containing protein [Sandaracinaceae bacterium]
MPHQATSAGRTRGTGRRNPVAGPVIAGLLTCASACTGALDGGPYRPGETGSAPSAHFATTRLRRLTQYEYARAVDQLVGRAHPETLMLYPIDPRTPFDDDADEQDPTASLVNGVELLATETAEDLLADPARRDTVIGCIPSGPTDDACMRSFVERFGRRAIRRPVPSDDVDRYVAGALAIATEEGDFYAGAGIVVRAFLQHPRFLYRVEVGTPVDGTPDVVRLDDWELASRLSFLVWGTPPDDALLDAAARGELHDADGVIARAEEMLLDARAGEQAARIHAMWLGIEILPHSTSLSAAMRDESATLVREVLLSQDRPWRDLFREPGTYVNDELAAIYGLPAPGSSEPTYVPYGEGTRQGILSHGAFLSHGGSTGERAPIHRGLAVRRRLLCETIELPRGFMPPPLPEPTSGQCRADLLAAHRTGGCAGCHDRIDPVGFGLEGYDIAGRVQSTEPGRPECTIEGAGMLDGHAFAGPRGLADLLLEDARMTECFESQLYRFAMGHSSLTDEDSQVLAELRHGLVDEEFTYGELVRVLVGSSAFLYRREPE